VLRRILETLMEEVAGDRRKVHNEEPGNFHASADQMEDDKMGGKSMKQHEDDRCIANYIQT
jgi:hypothetical protein